MKFTCRLNFIDCPEIKPLKTKINREIEIKEAMKARNRLIQLSTNCKCELNNELSKKEIVSLLKNNTKIIPIQCYEFDKYGRLLVVIFYEDSIINNILINEGFAKSYSGGTKK
jgi:endonuclease YncB( thermonuclease family)